MFKVVIGKGRKATIDIRAADGEIPPGVIRVTVWPKGIEKDKLTFKQSLVIMGKIWRGELTPWEVFLDRESARELITALEEARKAVGGGESR